MTEDDAPDYEELYRDLFNDVARHVGEIDDNIVSFGNNFKRADQLSEEMAGRLGAEYERRAAELFGMYDLSAKLVSRFARLVEQKYPEPSDEKSNEDLV